VSPGAAARLPPPAGLTGLLAEAALFALESARAVTPAQLSRPTPCRGWDLRMLLHHGCESLQALHEGMTSGCVRLIAAAPGQDQRLNPAGTFCDRIAGLLAASRRLSRGNVTIGDRDLGLNLLTAAGALEIAVHGWDIAATCGAGRPVPASLAADLLALAPLLVPAAGRGPLFAAPVDPGPAACPGEQLTAFLGRRRPAS
jgi:uncharacterized protein (TIGR03086 family)